MVKLNSFVLWREKRDNEGVCIYLGQYLLRTLKADTTAQAACSAGERHGIQAHLQFGVLLLKAQAPRSRFRPVILLLVIPGGAVHKGRPAAAAHPKTPHAGRSICVGSVGLSRIVSHKNQYFQFVEKHADPIFEHVWLH